MGIQSQQELDFEKQLVVHKSHSEMQRLNLQAAFTYVTEGTKAAFLLNGAAGIAVMTFIGTQKPATWPAKVLTLPLTLFAIGAMLAVATFGLAYVAQGYYAEMNFHHRSESPTANRFRNLGVVSFAGAVICFVVGLLTAAARL